jgi:hypothetical protein
MTRDERLDEVASLLRLAILRRKSRLQTGPESLPHGLAFPDDLDHHVPGKGANA